MPSADVAVIGAGLAGLLTAVRLAENGARVAVLSEGNGALHWAGGPIDLGFRPGARSAAAVVGPQKGATAADVAALDAALATFAGVLGRELGRDARDEPGAGAAGGLGAALLALGAVRRSGAALVRELTGLDEALDGAAIAITGEGSFDWQSLRGKLVTSVAAGAAERGLPCLVLAGQVAVGRREAAAAGVDAAYAVTEHAGSVEASLADPAGTLEALAASVAAQWGGR